LTIFFYLLTAKIFTMIQAPHFQTTLEGNPRCNVGDHRTLHVVNLLGGLCLIADPSTLPLPGTRWSHQFPMEEVFHIFFCLVWFL
jgi:hypothetical protein